MPTPEKCEPVCGRQMVEVDCFALGRIVHPHPDGPRVMVLGHIPDSAMYLAIRPDSESGGTMKLWVDPSTVCEHQL